MVGCFYPGDGSFPNRSRLEFGGIGGTMRHGDDRGRVSNGLCIRTVVATRLYRPSRRTDLGMGKVGTAFTPARSASSPRSDWLRVRYCICLACNLYCIVCRHTRISTLRPLAAENIRLGGCSFALRSRLLLHRRMATKHTAMALSPFILGYAGALVYMGVWRINSKQPTTIFGVKQRAPPSPIY